MQKRIENRVTLGLRFPSFRRAEIRPPFVDREGTESPPREVIKLGGASESPNLSRYTLDPGWRGLRFRYSEFQGFGRRIQPFLASSLVAVIRRVSLELSTVVVRVCIIPSTYRFYDPFYLVLSCPLHRLFARSKTRHRCKEGGRDFCCAYPSINISSHSRSRTVTNNTRYGSHVISYPSGKPRRYEMWLERGREICKQSYSEGKHVTWKYEPDPWNLRRHNSIKAARL